MTAEQARVLDEFESIVADEATYAYEDSAIQARMKALARMWLWLCLDL